MAESDKKSAKPIKPALPKDLKNTSARSAGLR